MGGQKIVYGKRVCKECGAREEEGAAFYAGMGTRCAECFKKRVKRNYRNSIEERHEYEKRRNATPERQAQLQAGSVRYRERNPEKRKARNAANNALRDGKLKRRGCEVCGKRAQMRHEDYSKPLEVRWFCRKHHDETHASKRDPPPRPPEDLFED